MECSLTTKSGKVCRNCSSVVKDDKCHCGHWVSSKDLLKTNSSYWCLDDETYKVYEKLILQEKNKGFFKTVLNKIKEVFS